MKKYHVKLKGTLPLIHGAMDRRQEDAPGGEARDRWYDEQWKYTHYANKEGYLVQPAYIIKAMLAGPGGGMRETAKSGSDKGKGRTEMISRAHLRIDPVMVPFGVKIPNGDSIRVLQPFEAWSLDPDDPTEVFILRRLVSRGVMISQLAIHGWELEFTLIDTSDGYFDAEWLQEGLSYAIETIGMGTWRPDFGRGKVEAFEQITE